MKRVSASCLGVIAGMGLQQQGLVSVSAVASPVSSEGRADLKTPSPKDLGTFGQTFEITERSLLDVIRTKLQTLEQSGALKSHQETLVAQVKQRLRNPEAVSGVRTTTQPRTFLYNPAIVVPYDLTDHKGRVFQRQGTVVNPLHTHALTKPLIFIDGDDPDQVGWALHQQIDRQKREEPPPKIILVKGSPFALMEQHDDTVFYFDQKGTLVKKLGITQVPARVTQAGDLLSIEEVNLDAP